MMPRVLFVDDEPLVLNGLRRMLRGRRKEWDVSFAGSGQEALGLLSDTPFDVVVSDMRMPEMTGDVLLQEVAAQHPNCARLILSGHAELSAILGAVSPAHQFHAKPCDMAVLDRSLCAILEVLQTTVGGEEQGRLVGARHLPSTQEALHTLAEHLEGASPDPEETHRIVAGDVAMTAQVLRLVNSAFFGKPTVTLDLTHALNALGSELLRRLMDESKLFRPSAGGAAEDEVRALNDAARRLADAVDVAAKHADHLTDHVSRARVAAMLASAGPLACNGLSLESELSGCEQQTAVLLTLWGFDPELIATVTQRRAGEKTDFDGVAELLRLACANFHRVS